MSRWRREAMEQLPVLKKTVENSPTIMYLWIELRAALNDAYRKENADDKFVASIYNFALWCWRGADNQDAATAVACAFYEHVPTDNAIRDDAARWLSKELFDELLQAGIFAYQLDAKELGDFVAQFTAAKKQLAAQYRPKSIR